MRRGTRKPCGLKVICYADHFIDLKNYLASLSGATLSDKTGVTELHDFVLNNMLTSCIKQAYVQDFDSLCF